MIVIAESHDYSYRWILDAMIRVRIGLQLGLGLRIRVSDPRWIVASSAHYTYRITSYQMQVFYNLVFIC